MPGCPRSTGAAVPAIPMEVKLAGPPSPRLNLRLVRLAHHFLETGTSRGWFTWPRPLSSDEITVSFACKGWLTQMETFVLQKPKTGTDDSLPTYQLLPVYPTTPPSHAQLPSWQLRFTGTEGLFDFLQVVCNSRNQNWVFQDTGQHIKHVHPSFCVACVLCPALVCGLRLQSCRAFHAQCWCP